MTSNDKTRVGVPTPYRILQLGFVLCHLALAAWMLYANRSFFHDDAYITLRYARNFLDGRGIVWNPGEPIQGYTNFLHLLLVSGLGLAGVDLVWASRVIGLLAYGALVVVLGCFLGRFGRHSPQERDLWHLPVALTLSSAPLIVWSIGGLESTLFALLSSSGCLLFMAALDRPASRRLPAASGACLALAYLAHPNGVVFIGISTAWLVLTWKSRPVRNAVAFVVPCLLVLTIYTIWQFCYYGDVVPNTFHVKAGNFSMHRLVIGGDYFQAYLHQPPYLPVLIVLTLVYARVAKKWHWNGNLAYLALVISGYISFVVFIGGDHMRAFRLMLPLIVPFSYMLYLLWVSVLDTSKRAVTGGLSLVLLVLSCLQVGQASLNPRREDPASCVGTMVGKYVSQAWPEGSLVALNTAGSTPYYATRHRYIDMLGLNDRHIAKRLVWKTELAWQNVPGHLKGDGDYVLSRCPDFIIVGPAEGADISRPWFLSDLEMSRDPRFAQNYQQHQVKLNPQGERVEQNGRVFTFYQRIK